MAYEPNPIQAGYRSGFSLIELMTVLAIVAVLAGIGLPGFQALLSNLQLTTSVNGFVEAIYLTRSEAIRRSARVDLAPADGANWERGWVIFIDKNDNQQADPGETVISRREAVPAGMVIKSILTDSSKPYIAYNGSGRTRTNASNQTPQLGTVSFSLNAGIRRIKLNFSGRARVCNPDKDRTCSGSDDED